MMNKYVERFLRFIDIELGYSEHTIKTYGLILVDFLEFLQVRRIRLKRLKKKHLERYILYLRRERNNSAKSIRLKIEALLSFFKFLTERVKLFRNNPIGPSDFKYKVEQKEADSMSEHQIQGLLDALEEEIRRIEEELERTKGKTVLWRKRVFAAKRDRILTKLLVSTGLRISEALGIRIRDIDFVDKSIQILGKGKKYRQVFYDLEEVEEEFIQYVEEWKKLSLEHEYLFVSIKSYIKLTSRGFQVLLKKYLQQAGLRLSITPHVLRHTFATITLEKGANIKAVSQLLGHSNCEITIDLYTHLSSEHLREVMQKCNPLSKQMIPIEERIEMRKKYLAYLRRSG